MTLTNRGKYLMLETFFLNQNVPTTFYLALIAAGTTAPTVDTNTMSDLTEIGAGNGYTSGGVSFTRASGSGATLTENDTSDYAEITLKTIGIEASGGTIPITGSARYAVLTTDEATVADRQIVAFEDLGADEVCPDGKVLTLTGHKVRLTEPS